MPDNHFTVNPLYVDRSKPSWLTEHLYLAGSATARNHELLRELGITAIVNLTPENYGCEDAGFKVLQIPILDGHPFEPTWLDVFLGAVDLWKRQEEVVLIHCHGGVSRTASFAIAWLMHEAGANAEDDLRSLWSFAEDRVREARPIIIPHYALKKTILDYFAAR